MTAKGDLQDQAQGMVLKVAKVTPITECGLTEIEFTDAKYTRYGYFKGEYNRNDGIKKFGEGVKSTNPCTEFTSMGNFGSLQFS